MAGPRGGADCPRSCPERSNPERSNFSWTVRSARYSPHMAPPPFDAPLSHYLTEAADVFGRWRRQDPAALAFFRQHHPRFRRADVPWMPTADADAAVRTASFSTDDARLAVARAHDFLDWASLAAWVTALDGRDPDVYPFECAVEAVVHGDDAALRRLLEPRPALVHARSTRRTPFDPPRHACTLLHYVAANGVEGARQRTPANAVDITSTLLGAGADPNALASLYGGECTTLSLLVSSSHPARAGLQVALAELLVTAGADLAPRGTGTWTSPLMSALAFGFVDTAEALVRLGADIDSLAAAAGLDRLADVAARLPSAEADDRQRALALAAQLGRTEVVALLLQAGVDPDRYNPRGLHQHATPLHHAALGGYADTVKVLLAHGARTDLRDAIYDATPEGWARHAGHAAVGELLHG
jgi:hypothetical protein